MITKQCGIQLIVQQLRELLQRHAMFDSDYSVISNQVQTDSPYLNISPSSFPFQVLIIHQVSVGTA